MAVARRVAAAYDSLPFWARARVKRIGWRARGRLGEHWREEMCYRLSQALPAELLTRLFSAADVRREIPPPSWNMVPTQSVTVVAHAS